MNILKKSKIAHKSLCLLLLALFAGNVDANAVNLNKTLEPKIESAILKVAQQRTFTISTINQIASILKHKQDKEQQPAYDLFVKAAKGEKLARFISTLVNSIRDENCNCDARERAAHTLRMIIFSEQNKDALANFQEHSVLHYMDGGIKNLRAVKFITGDNELKTQHTKLTNYTFQYVFDNFFSSNILMSKDVDVEFRVLQNNDNEYKLDIRAPLLKICNTKDKHPEIQELTNKDPKEIYNPSTKYFMHCMINVVNDGTIKKQKDMKKPFDGKSGSCFPETK